MTRRGCLFGLLGVLIGLAVVLDVGDVGARHYATSKIAARIRTNVPEAGGVSARIHSWPFLKALVNGQVDEVGAHATRLVEKTLVFTDVDVDLRGVHISVNDLLTAGKVTVLRIDRGTVRLSITTADLEKALGVSTLPIGKVTVSFDAATHKLAVSAGGLGRIELALPGANVLPCSPQVTQVVDKVTLTCSFTQVPQAFTTLAS